MYREPHWHPNAVELGYCLAGRALMTIFSPGAGHDTFIVDPGEIVFVPRGYLHHIENIHQGDTKFAIAFNHELPEDIGISGSAGSMTEVYLERHSDFHPDILGGSRDLVKIYL